jgi:hypothetical protein
VVANPGLNAGCRGPALDHPVGVLLPQRLRPAGLPPGGAEQGAVWLVGDAGGTGSRLRGSASAGYISGLFVDLGWTRGLDLTVGENRR